MAGLFAPGCKFAPTLEVVQIYLHPGANLHPVQIVHMNAKCLISIHFIGYFDLLQAFSITILYKTNIKMNLKLFFMKIKIRQFISADQTSK